ncbi:hypothetical protein PISMIDRAFT_674509 [Pisolithus microcarpus 441]|uniref:Brain protein I3 n=1 Tax=Pisolithus microcarpus 441 TaxID=765257 RepID=A0A0C9ZE86_9AGAM|nr:hypothetical protein BKA83DRAFT_674509 [Pisolithus microcarpus]KIK27616.1 hypothetical protein PISMIDRAFT_674509 [Pisolithus microcarpus 441]
MLTYSDNPPAYEFVASQTNSGSDGQDPRSLDKADAKPIAQQTHQSPPTVPPVMSVHGRPAPTMQPTTVYHYHNLQTDDHLASLLPPDHPEMVCLQEGRHDTQTRFGILGLLAAIVWFPLGVGLCLLDRRVVCKRCGLLIDDGVCG